MKFLDKIDLRFRDKKSIITTLLASLIIGEVAYGRITNEVRSDSYDLGALTTVMGVFSEKPFSRRTRKKDETKDGSA